MGLFRRAWRKLLGRKPTTNTTSALPSPNDLPTQLYMCQAAHDVSTSPVRNGLSPHTLMGVVDLAGLPSEEIVTTAFERKIENVIGEIRTIGHEWSLDSLDRLSSPSSTNDGTTTSWVQESRSRIYSPTSDASTSSTILKPVTRSEDHSSDKRSSSTASLEEFDPAQDTISIPDVDKERLEELKTIAFSASRGHLEAALLVTDLFEEAVSGNASDSALYLWHLGDQTFTAQDLSRSEIRVLYRAKIMLEVFIACMEGQISLEDHELFKQQLFPDDGCAPLLSASAFDVFSSNFFCRGIFDARQKRDIVELQPFFDEEPTLDPEAGINSLLSLEFMTDEEFEGLPEYWEVEYDARYNEKFRRPPLSNYQLYEHPDDTENAVRDERPLDAICQHLSSLVWDAEGPEEREWIQQYRCRWSASPVKCFT